MTRAKRYLLALAGLAVLAGAPLYVARSAPHIPPYDANLVRLAESELEGYCAGETFWGSQAQGNADMARDCRSRLAGQKAATPNLPAVVPAFCTAIIDSGWEGSQWQCEEIMASNKYWPTYDGSITNAWNRARKYPVSPIAVKSTPPEDTSRTGDRPDRTRPDEAARGLGGIP